MEQAINHIKNTQKYTHNHTHTYINTYMHTRDVIKMTDDEDQQAENTFETLVSITDKNSRYSGPPAAEIEAETAGL